MIDRLRVEDFQSLANVDIELGGLTVVVGASSSGKSALVRAVRLLAANASGTSYVRRGRSYARVEALVGPRVLVQRGKESFFEVDHAPEWTGEGGVEPVPERYTKVGTKVPEEVSVALALPSDDGLDVHLAEQFDPPFLLTAPGSKVASVLGELTNLVLALDAAKEANRRRLQALQAVKADEEAQAAIEAKGLEYLDLPAQQDAVTQAESSCREIRHLQTQLAGLTQAVSTVHVAQVAARVRLPVVPDLTALEELAVQLEGLHHALYAVTVWEGEAANLSAQAESAQTAVAQAEEEYRIVLESAGTCPTCGQPIKETSHAHV